MALHSQKWLIKTIISAIQGIAAIGVLIQYQMIIDTQAKLSGLELSQKL